MTTGPSTLPRIDASARRGDEPALFQHRDLASDLADQEGLLLKRVLMLGQHLFELAVVVLGQKGDELFVQGLLIRIAFDRFVKGDRHQAGVVKFLLQDKCELVGMELQHIGRDSVEYLIAERGVFHQAFNQAEFPDIVGSCHLRYSARHALLLCQTDQRGADGEFGRQKPFVLLLQQRRERLEIADTLMQRLLFGFRIAKVIGAKGLFEDKFDERFCLVEHRIECVDLPGVHHVGRVLTPFEDDDAAVKTACAQQSRGFQRCGAPGTVAVVGHDDAGLAFAQKREVLGRQGGAQGRNGLVETGLVQHHHIKVPLGDDDLSLFVDRLLGQIVGIEQAGFVEKLGLRRVDVLGLMAGDGPPSETDDGAVGCMDREDNAFDEACELTAVFASCDTEFDGFAHAVLVRFDKPDGPR